MYYNYNVMEQVKTHNNMTISLSIKRMLSVFLALAILFNVSITKNHEFKDKFLLAFGCAVSTIDFTVFNEYTNVILNTVNNIMQSLMPVVITKTKIKKENNNKNDNKPVPVNSSSDEVIITKKISEISGTLNFVNTKATDSVYGVISQNNMLYRHVLISSENIILNVGILFFILFSIFIVRKRDEIVKNILKRIEENRLAC